MHQRNDLIAIEEWIGFWDTQADDDSSLADEDERPILGCDVVRLAGRGDDAERLKGILVQLGYQILGTHSPAPGLETLTPAPAPGRSGPGSDLCRVPPTIRTARSRRSCRSAPDAGRG